MRGVRGEGGGRGLLKWSLFALTGRKSCRLRRALRIEGGRKRDGERFYETPPCAVALGGCCIDAEPWKHFALLASLPRAINSLRRAGRGLFDPARLRHAFGLGNCAR